MRQFLVRDCKNATSLSVKADLPDSITCLTASLRHIYLIVFFVSTRVQLSSAKDDWSEFADRYWSRSTA